LRQDWPGAPRHPRLRSATGSRPLTRSPSPGWSATCGCPAWSPGDPAGVGRRREQPARTRRGPAAAL